MEAVAAELRLLWDCLLEGHLVEVVVLLLDRGRHQGWLHLLWHAAHVLLLVHQVLRLWRVDLARRRHHLLQRLWVGIRARAYLNLVELAWVLASTELRVRRRSLHHVLGIRIWGVGLRRLYLLLLWDLRLQTLARRTVLKLL